MTTVLVTGAAGSIGSAVVNRLAKAGHAVIAFDQAETPLFWLGKQLEREGLSARLALGSIRDRARVEEVMRTARVVIHAAALKHVGACEAHVCEAIKTNVEGTANVLGAARKRRIRVVLVSTDKAVKPTSVMGATKTLAEWLTGHRPDNRIVRLVNVWGSHGSLLPVVEEQIRAGGPVTVTDRRMARYFMTSDEAAEIIMEHALDVTKYHVAVLSTDIGRQPELVIDKINAILKARGVPDMEVIETGMQPGEKLVEDLCTADEMAGGPRRPSFWAIMAIGVLVSMSYGRRVDEGELRRYLMSLAGKFSHD